jgi:hypothetical protein
MSDSSSFLHVWKAEEKNAHKESRSFVLTPQSTGMLGGVNAEVPT